MATSSLSHRSFQGSILHKSYFLGQNYILVSPHRSLYTIKTSKQIAVKPISAKFNLFELLGGRGLCNGEAGIQQELKKDVKNTTQPSEQGSSDDTTVSASPAAVEGLPENAFEKEMLGLTGGFPGGEKGLKKFILENPPPKKEEEETKDGKWLVQGSKKPKPPELPLLLPGMIAIVKNPNNPFYMYCGIVQRITDGKAGVIFEGGNWDRLVTFRLEELEKREKGPPMVNPKSVVLEPLVEQLEKQSSQP